jgi:hypothetical protein
LLAETEFKLCVAEVIYESSTINMPPIFHYRMFTSHVKLVMKTVNNNIIIGTRTVTGAMYNLHNMLHPGSFQIQLQKHTKKLNKRTTQKMGFEPQTL